VPPEVFQTMKAFVIAVGVVLVIALVVLVIFGARFLTPRAPTAAEKQLVVTDAQLTELGVGGLTPAKCATIQSSRGIDGALTVEYQYDSHKDPAAKQGLYLSSEAEIAHSELFAMRAFRTRVGGYNAGIFLASRKIKVYEWPELITFGDQHYAAVLRNGNASVGNIFVVRQGRVVHSLILSGMYFDNADNVRDLFAPLLKESARQNR